MNILFLGYGKQETKLIDFLIDRNHDVNYSSHKFEDLSDYDLVISFGYKYIFKEYQLQTLQRPIINLHISYLPFNRGAHPNFWAHYKKTKSGVSIHEIDRGIDTGPIIFRKEVRFLDSKISLKESYNRLKVEIEKLFIENVDLIESREYKMIFPDHIGSFHAKSDLPDWVNWNMTIEDIRNK